MKKLTYLFFLFLLLSCNNPGEVRFAICADVHQDLIHDAGDRVSTFIKHAEKENVDFIIQLGDFCLPFDVNEPFLKRWDSFDGDKYHVLGNHDMDVSPKAFIQDFLGMQKAYYSFDSGDFHFVVLDPNYYIKEEKIIPYNNGNYYSNPESRSYVPKPQLEWLRADLAKTDKRTVVFSHQSLEHWGGIKNREEIRKLFSEANKPVKKVIACFSGHDHQDRHKEIDGIHYIGINSMSYAWVGEKLEYSGRFPESVEKKYSNLKYTLPYREAVYAVVEIDKTGKLRINGVQSEFIKPGPEELGVKEHPYSASISDRELEF